MDIYDSGVFVESIVFNTYTDGVNTFFETTEDTAFNPPVTSPITISYNADAWQMSYGSGDETVVFGTFTTASICPITDCDWVLDPEVVSSTFTISVSSVDCGCCDESLNVELTYLDDDYTATASIVKDEYGNTLAFNGYPYYSFTIYTGDEPVNFFINYNGNYWTVNEGSIGGTSYSKLNSDSECPFGPYDIFESFTRFSVTGAECFDCCNYYTPRFSNFIKKKKYQLVDGISAIRSKELFGFKCGPEWTDLAKQHLILNVLHCLPYGVLCEETEQCLMNNLNENCNC
jgi:hypothetical protein